MIVYIKTTSTAENKRDNSPKDLAQALAWNGGIQNSCVQFIELDRGRFAEFNNAVEKTLEQAMKYFSRAGDIELVDEQLCNKQDPDPSAWKDIDFTWRVWWAYSGIGDGATFHCSLGAGGIFCLLGEIDAAASSLAPKTSQGYDGAEAAQEDDDAEAAQEDEDEATEDDDNNSSIKLMESSIQSEHDALDLYLDDIEHSNTASM